MGRWVVLLPVGMVIWISHMQCGTYSTGCSSSYAQMCRNRIEWDGCDGMQAVQERSLIGGQEMGMSWCG